MEGYLHLRFGGLIFGRAYFFFGGGGGGLIIGILRYSTRSVNIKQKIVQGCGPANINCSSFVIAFEVRRLS